MRKRLVELIPTILCLIAGGIGMYFNIKLWGVPFVFAVILHPGVK